MENNEPNKTVKTLQECKESLANRIGYKDWAHCIDHHITEGVVESLLDDMSKLYSQSQTEERDSEIKRLNIELSNYAYQIDRAKRDRDKAESDNEAIAKHNADLLKTIEAQQNEIVRLQRENERLVNIITERVSDSKEYFVPVESKETPILKEKPTMEKYGWHTQSGFDDEPSGWMFEGGEEAYLEAIKNWQK